MGPREIAFASLVLLSLSTSSAADQPKARTFVDSETLRQACDEQREMATIFVVAVIDTIHTFQAQHYLSVKHFTCVPIGARGEQVTREVCDFLSAHPTIPNVTAVDVIEVAVRSKWPCE